VAANWNPRTPGAKCRVETYHTHFTNGVYGIITDFIILFLPIPTVVRLKTDRKKKCEAQSFLFLPVISHSSNVTLLPYSTGSKI
jgi:hypothetical protein